jgi:GDPmannose 4,6-dehydratase
MNLKNKNVLITGISGFVGSYLSKALLEKGANVFGFDRNLRNNNDTNNLNTIKGDLLDTNSLNNAFDNNIDFVFHLAAQPFIPRSFENPKETYEINGTGTLNLLESIVLKELDCKVIFASSSDEYGLVFSSESQYIGAKKKYGNIFPEPIGFPELPISEENPLRPLSPYAVSKVYGDFLMRNYYHAYGLDTVVSRSFSHEGHGRGSMFVTSVITEQVDKFKKGLIDKISIGNVNAFRDWSHVKDIIEGYILLAKKGLSGEVYNQGSMRTNSVLSYILLSLEESGWNIDKIETLNGDKKIHNPTEIDKSKVYGVKFDKTIVDCKMLEECLDYSLKDKGINVYSGDKKMVVEFDKNRFRPAEVPIFLSNTNKIQKIGFKIENSVNDIIKDQLNYFK